MQESGLSKKMAERDSLVADSSYVSRQSIGIADTAPVTAKRLTENKKPIARVKAKAVSTSVPAPAPAPVTPPAATPKKSSACCGTSR